MRTTAESWWRCPLPPRLATPPDGGRCHLTVPPGWTQILCVVGRARSGSSTHHVLWSSIHEGEYHFTSADGSGGHCPPQHTHTHGLSQVYFQHRYQKDFFFFVTSKKGLSNNPRGQRWEPASLPVITHLSTELMTVAGGRGLGARSHVMSPTLAKGLWGRAGAKECGLYRKNVHTTNLCSQVYNKNFIISDQVWIQGCWSWPTGSFLLFFLCCWWGWRWGGVNIHPLTDPLSRRSVCVFRLGAAAAAEMEALTQDEQWAHLLWRLTGQQAARRTMSPSPASHTAPDNDHFHRW